MKVNIYTDGSSLKNPGPSAWACVIELEDKSFTEHSGFIGHSTNNRAELEAVIEGLKLVSNGSDVHVFSDSQLTVEIIKGNYKRKSNMDLWSDYDFVVNVKDLVVNVTHVARNSTVHNESCDRLARSAALANK